ncbi:MAG: MFS transporter [Nitrososphaera sp.]|uniref:MFS transporter n=1 Tax=Nitrososphaera sp. TaxID=1971748 RepID=UPI003D6EEE65
MTDKSGNSSKDDKSATRQGLRQNLSQFVILIIVNGFVGAMIGLEQTVLPLIGKNVLGIDSNVIILSFIASFGLVKAFLNLYAGALAERLGRKKVLIVGWLFGIPVPFILLFAPDWNWIIFANVLLGVNQALAWSMTVNMKIDLVGKEKRGLALGFNEFAGYISVAIVGFATGYVASIYGLKPYPFYMGIAFALLGTLLSIVIVRDTRKFMQLEIKNHDQPNNEPDAGNAGSQSKLTFKQVFVQTSWQNRTLLSVSQAGLVNNLIFGVTWGLFTLYFASFQLSVNDIGFLKALHPAVWGLLQLGTGSLSDRIGRKVLIYSGMIVQALGIWIVLYGNSMIAWIGGMSLIGVGTAFVYPTLLAAISDIAHPAWRATSLGVYRFWRDLGFVFGALGVGFLADFLGANAAIHTVAWIALSSGIFVFVVMRETISKKA